MKIETIKQCSTIKDYLKSQLGEVELNDICYSYDILCYLLSNNHYTHKLTDQYAITNRAINKKIEIINHSAKFAFTLDLDLETYRNVGMNYIELIRFNTNIMNEMTIKDDLTGTLNYNHLKSLSARLSKEYFMLFFFDLNGFKKINDTYGHDYGNGILKSFAKALDESVRINDLVFRYGGDEFIIILLRHHIEPNKLISRINKRLSSVDISYSAGWAYNEEFDLFKTIKMADSLMYKNKRKVQ